MAVTLTSTGITYSDGTSSSTAFSQTLPKWAETRTNANRSLVGDSGWVNHLSLTFTSTRTDMIHMFFNASQAYESGVVSFYFRFSLDGTIYDPGVLSAYQLGQNRAAGGHATDYAVEKSAGSHTAIVQVRNPTGGSTGIMNYFGGGYDVFSCYYY